MLNNFYFYLLQVLEGKVMNVMFKRIIKGTTFLQEFCFNFCWRFTMQHFESKIFASPALVFFFVFSLVFVNIKIYVLQTNVLNYHCVFICNNNFSMLCSMSSNPTLLLVILHVDMFVARFYNINNSKIILNCVSLLFTKSATIICSDPDNFK